MNTKTRTCRWVWASALVATVSLAPGAAGQPPPLPGPAAAHAPVAGRADHHDVSPALRDMAPVQAPGISLFRSKRWARLPRNVRSQASVSADPAVQTEPGVPSTPSTSTNFEGISSDAQSAATGLVVLPPDPSIDVGPNHIVEWVNLTFAVYNKSGVKLYGPAAGNTLWQGFGGACQTSNDGDPIVLYDHLADRWLMSQLAVPNFPNGPFYQCIAVSKTGDPLGEYHRYAFVISNTDLNDYPKFGVWPDGYYMAVNHFYCYDWLPPFGFIACDWAGQGAYAFERDKMLQGLSAQMVGSRLPTSNLGGMLPSDLDGPAPPAGTPNYFVQVDDDAWLPPNDPYGPDADRLQVWAFTPNWTTPLSSTFTQVAVLPTAPFDSNMCGYSPNCIPQPGVDILNDPSPPVDALADRLMWRLQYRYFAQGGYHSLVSNHTVDTNGADQAGIRWYELRNTGAGWQIQQQATYAPGDGLHRWMGSMAMDSAGNIALGYSVGSLTKSPSIRYAGRDATDPAGQLGTEASIVEVMGGQGYQLDSSGRWGDYNTMALDPDGCTFWYGGEYYGDSDIFYGRNWQTRIASFQFPSCGGPGLPSVSIDDVTLAEGNTGTMAFTFSVSLSAASSQTVTVNYATANGTATDGTDYTGGSGTLTFNPSETSQTVTVLVNGDTMNEGSETFVVNLSGATNATIADAQGLGTILNDDPVPSISINDVAVTEGNIATTNAVFTVSLSAASGQTVTVNYATANGDAAAGSDYVAIPLTLFTFNPGETQKIITIQVNGDTTDEPNETFLVNLSGATNATIADNQGVGTITDDDGGPALSISDVAVTEGDTGTKDLTFTVTLSAASGLPVSVDWATANGDAIAGSDYVGGSGTVTFAAGETSKPLTVPVNGDTASESTEAFFVNLTNPVNATIADSQGVGTILDNDSAPASITVSSPNGGETWTVGSARTISWTSTNVSGPVQARISRNGGSSWTTLYSTTNDGNEVWTVTGPATKKARIRVCDAAGAVCDTSNRNFTIK